MIIKLTVVNLEKVNGKGQNISGLYTWQKWTATIAFTSSFASICTALLSTLAQLTSNTDLDSQLTACTLQREICTKNQLQKEFSTCSRLQLKQYICTKILGLEMRTFRGKTKEKKNNTESMSRGGQLWTIHLGSAITIRVVRL